MNEVFPLVYFTHAELKEKENLNANLETIQPTNDSNRFKSTFESNRPKKKLKLTIQDANMSYEAAEEDEQPFLVGVLDKKSGKISVCNTSYFLMKPECFLSSNDNEKNADLTISQQGSYADKLNHLTAAFGSSKKQKAMHTKQKNKLDNETLDTAISLAVEETRKNPSRIASKNSETLEDSESLEQFSIMPVANKDAKEPNEVYNLNDILSFTQMEFERFTLELSKKFAVSTHESIAKWKESNIYPEFVCEHLSLLISSKSNQEFKIVKCKQMAYMSYLIQLYRLNSAQLRSKTPLNAYQIPDSACSKLFSLYTVVSTDNSQSKKVRSMPRRLKDKLTCHILILALHIDNFLTSLEGLQKDLKLSIGKLCDFYLALGCFIKTAVVSVDGKRVVCKKSSLTLPLNEITKGEQKKRARKL